MHYPRRLLRHNPLILCLALLAALLGGCGVPAANTPLPAATSAPASAVASAVPPTTVPTPTVQPTDRPTEAPPATARPTDRPTEAPSATVVPTKVPSVTPMPTAPAPTAAAGAAAGEAGFTEETLLNATYELPDFGAITLVNGKYEKLGQNETALAGLDRVALGDLNADGAPDGAGIVWYNEGGSGTFIYLVAVLDEGGKPRQAALELIGDRVRIHRLSVDEQGQIGLSMVTHGPEDPLCCPTQITERTYALSDAAFEVLAEQVSEPPLKPEQVSLDASSVAGFAAGEVIPAMPYQHDVPPPNGAPAHVRFTFGEGMASEWFDPREMQLLIYPLPEFLTLYETAGDSTADERVEALARLIEMRPSQVGGEIPALPVLPAVQVVQAQVKYVNFQGGQGVRLVTFYAQDVSPMTDEVALYTFQGITNDGGYYVAFWAPITSTVLPDSFADSPASKDYDAFAKGMEQYLTDLTGTLNDAPAEAFEPNLEAIDQMIASLSIRAE